MPETYIRIPYPIVEEGSSFTATADFRVADAGTAPTTAKYRIDCLSSGTNLKDWTSLSVAESINITVTATENAIVHSNNKFERKQITVAADPDTTTQTRDTVVYKVRNISGF